MKFKKYLLIFISYLFFSINLNSMELDIKKIDALKENVVKTVIAIFKHNNACTQEELYDKARVVFLRKYLLFDLEKIVNNDKEFNHIKSLVERLKFFFKQMDEIRKPENDFEVEDYHAYVDTLNMILVSFKKEKFCSDDELKLKIFILREKIEILDKLGQLARSFDKRGTFEILCEIGVIPFLIDMVFVFTKNELQDYNDEN